MAVLCLCLCLAACGGGSARSGENPNAVLKEATLRGIESAAVDLTVNAQASGKEGGRLEASASGAFESEGSVNLPLLELNGTAKGQVNGKPVDAEGGITLLSGAAYVSYEGTAYEVDPSTLAFVESVFNPIRLENGVEKESPGPVVCEEEAGKLKVADLVAKPKNEGSADVEGTTTTKISGELNVSAALDALLELAEGEGCKNQFSSATTLPTKAEIEKAKAEANSDLESSHVDVYVGDDDIVRQVSLTLQGEPKSGGSGLSNGAVEVDLKLSGVNEEQKIAAPENPKPVSRLFLKLGVNPLALMGELQGGGLVGLLEELAGVQQR